MLKIIKVLLFFRTFCCIFTLINTNTADQIIDPCNNKQFEIVSDLSPEDCEEGYFYKLTGNDIHNCFPKCEKKHDLSVPCNPNLCPPGYVCPKPNNTNDDTYCQIDQNSCFKYYVDNPNNNPWKDAWKPKCLPDGTWAPKQCKGETNNGRCFCYDSVGNRIFGQEFISKATNMTCACSRKRLELMNSGSRSYTTLHCDSMGNYESLQCDDGQCWCVETVTGVINAQVVPEKMMNLLPCYSKEQIGETYMRLCESEKYAQKTIEHEFLVHGTKALTFPHLICDDDGSYGPYQIINGLAFCKWKDNSNILSYSVSIDSNIDDLNCHCARDTKIYESANLTQHLLCNGNGNYKPQQKLNNGKWYCVDKDGYKNSDYFNEFPNCIDYI